ncbi:MAG: homocysteine S-methyltransferase family protein, partial [Clostridia bacterium]|nr:homocysteine S-methyltransferase family protein [Clostridia bacterium]
MKDFRTALAGCEGKGFLLFDGATGTLLHSRGLPAGVAPEVWGITRPDAVCGIHRSYIEAGADIIKSNTFGANSLNYPDGGGITVDRMAAAGLRNIRRASELAGREVYAAYDIGPCGRLVGSDITFDGAYEVFAASVRAAVAAGGYDLILLETFGDLSEVRAALLAVKENCDLPAVVTCAYGKDGRSFTGTPASVMSAALEGLGADAVGMNCSFGPGSMLDILPSVLDSVNIPVCVNPNAGLPSAGRSGRAVYDCGPGEFSETMTEIARRGAVLLGGCCGTTPEHIKALRSALSDIRPAAREKNVRCRISSRSEIFVFGGGDGGCSGPGYAVRASFGVAVIGERINPTGKKRFREALLAGDGDYAVSEALSQASLGADILDVNVGIPGIDEPAVLRKTVEDVQKVCHLPLQIDTSSPAAMEAALRIYDGLPLI